MPPDNENLDVKPSASDSSPKTDVIESSSDSATTNVQDVKANQSMVDFVRQNTKLPITADKASDSSPESEGATEDGQVETDKIVELNSKNESDLNKLEGEVEQEEGSTEKSEETEQVEATKPVPYERFAEKVNEAKQVKQQLEAVVPEVTNYRNITSFCEQNSITPEQFNQVLEVQALLNTNPPEALKRLLPIVESLQGFVGNKLPTDLQAKVDMGKMELDDAKEIASLRAKSTFGERKTQHDQQQMFRQQQSELTRTLTSAAQTWEQAKRSSDPDYKPKRSESEADGLWEMVRDKYLATVHQRNAQGEPMVTVRNAQELTSLMEKSYAAAKDTAKRFGGVRPATKKPLLSTGSSKIATKTSFEKASTMTEAVKIGMAQRGHTTR